MNFLKKLFVILIFILANCRCLEADCYSRPQLELYAGYSSHGQGHLWHSVIWLQALLNAKNNAGLELDGYFGPLTKEAVVQYQISRGLSADGIVGPQTWASLCGSTGYQYVRLHDRHIEKQNISRKTLNPFLSILIEKLTMKFPSKFDCKFRLMEPKSDFSGKIVDCFLGPYGVKVSGRRIKVGDAVNAWLKDNADELNVCYVIWKNRMWHRNFDIKLQGKQGIRNGNYDYVRISVKNLDNTC